MAPSYQSYFHDFADLNASLRTYETVISTTLLRVIGPEDATHEEKEELRAMGVTIK
jgi:hypothetical protein